MNNNINIPKIAGWFFEIKEISMGIYQCIAKNDKGVEFCMKGYTEDQIPYVLKELENKILVLKYKG